MHSTSDPRLAISPVSSPATPPAVDPDQHSAANDRKLCWVLDIALDGDQVHRQPHRGGGDPEGDGRDQHAGALRLQPR